MIKSIRFYEYSGFSIDSETETEDINQFPGRIEDLEYLKRINPHLLQDKPVFTFGNNTIKSNSIVGMISVGQTQIEILPKLVRPKNAPNDSALLKNLMFMLAYTHSLDVDDAGLANLSRNNDSFIEAYIGIFSTRLQKHLLRVGIPKNYISKSDNLNTVRGRIGFKENITLNQSNQAQIFCHYDEFSENNPIAQILKYVAHSLRMLTKNSANASFLDQCLGLMDGVEAKYHSSSALNQSFKSHRDPNFKGLINLAKMFLEKLRPDFHGSKRDNVFSLLFDMNELFEDFIFEVIKRNSNELNVNVIAQKKKRLVDGVRDLAPSREWQTKQLFDTYTDIIVTRPDGQTVIIDTKYKVLSSQKSHFGISNSDVYQILAYGEIHHQSISRKVVLAFPLAAEPIKKEFRIHDSSSSFQVWTLDITQDLSKSIDLLVDDLQRLIGA